MHASQNALPGCCTSEHPSSRAAGAEVEDSVCGVDNGSDFEVIDVDPSSSEESWVRLDVSAYQRRHWHQPECASVPPERGRDGSNVAHDATSALSNVAESQMMLVSAQPELAMPHSAQLPSCPSAPPSQSLPALPASPARPPTSTQCSRFARWLVGYAQDTPINTTATTTSTTTLPVYRRECECLGARYGFHRAGCPHDPFRLCHCLGAEVNIHHPDCMRGSSVT